MANAHIQTLMQKELSRKEFLAVAALAVASIFGFGTIIKLFTGKSLSTHKSLSNYNSASSTYGK